MQLKRRFLISLIVILLVSWADVFFAGTHAYVFFPLVVRQILHFTALLLTMSIGCLNWKDYDEKWLLTLWLAVYTILILIIMGTALLYLLHVPHSDTLVRAAIYLRNRFTWPIIFLVWYMLHLMTRYVVPKNKEQV